MAKNKNITLKAEDFHYPTKAEFQEINTFKPKFIFFSFDYKDEGVDFFDGEDKFSPKGINKINHLYWWNRILKNKANNMMRSYSRALVNFKRGIPKIEDFNYSNYINKIQFDFYSETYFYFFSSVQDTVWQILNVYYDIGLDEEKVYVKDLLSGIKNEYVKEKVIKFRSATADINKIRNKFTHRYPANIPDYRTAYTEEVGKQILEMGQGGFIKPSDLANQIRISLEQLASFIADLSKLMP